MTLHEDWHKAHPNYPCEYDTCPRGQVLDLENATYTAAEVKVLTEAALRLGRREAFDEALGEIQKEARWQTELLNRDNWSQWDQSIDRLQVVYGCIRHLAGDGTWEATPDSSETRTDPSMSMDLPPEPQAVREPPVDLEAEQRKAADMIDPKAMRWIPRGDT